MGAKKKWNIILIIIAVLLVIGTVVVYLIGEQRIKWPEKKTITGAKEVDSKNIENPKEDKIDEDKTDANIEPDKASVSKDRFKGMTLKYNDKGIPVLMYHSIDREVDANGRLNELKVPREVFREQMKYLKDNGFTTLTMDEVYRFFIHNEGVPEKSVVITFDDGYVDNYTNALPILKEFGFNATIFMITQGMEISPHLYMSKDQLKEMEASGIEIQSHTVKHDKMDTLPYNEQLRDLKESKEFLEKLLNKTVDYFAYPYGRYNQNTLRALEEAGYTMAFSSSGTWSDKSNGIYTLDRVYISAHHSMEQFIDRVNNRNYR